MASGFNMRNIRQSKRPHSTISNLEDREMSKSASPGIVGSATTTGLMKPPTNFSAKLQTSASLDELTNVPAASASKDTVQEEEEDFTELEDLLEKELSS